MSHWFDLIAIPTLVMSLAAAPAWSQDADVDEAQANAVRQSVVNPEGVPEPSLVPRSWDLEIITQTLRPILVQTPSGVYESYWYMPYKLVNNTGQERQFVPEFVMATDKGDVIEAGRHVSPSAFDAIKAKLGNPLLESPNEVIGRILQGNDFARESVAIWKHPGHDIDQVRIFASGLSGETIRIANPLTNDTVVLRKTYMLTFDLPGTTESIDRATVIPGQSRWIMR
jgi:hypothetical protein